MTGRLNRGSLLALIAAIPEPVQDLTQPPHLLITFVPEVGTNGVSTNMPITGFLKQGTLQLGQKVEIRPGLIVWDSQEVVGYTPFVAQITSIAAAGRNLQSAIPGDMITVETDLNGPRDLRNLLPGQMLGRSLPPVYNRIKVDNWVLRRNRGQARQLKILTGDNLLVSLGPRKTRGRAVQVAPGNLRIGMESPLCVGLGQKLVLFRHIPDQNWVVTGFGTVIGGIKAERIGLEIAEE
ncbi:eukaryotic translation initiation factor 2 eIF2-gamma-II [Ceratobasidium sp. AG-Ba]|nr:eukaryotic translation initiation factor 2 eIF2-gamma-II [Ceratobasidium sp. AG-Ba]